MLSWEGGGVYESSGKPLTGLRSEFWEYLLGTDLDEYLMQLGDCLAENILQEQW